MSNLSVFERNVIHAFAAYDLTDDQLNDAEAMFLKHGGDVEAETATLREIESWDQANSLLPLAAKAYEGQGKTIAADALSSLSAFLRDTGYRHHHPERRNTPWKHWRDC